MDLVITRHAEYILNAISVDDSSEISDHYTVCADLRFVKPNWERKRICGRKLKAISLEHFRQDVAMSPLFSESSNDLLTLLHLYNSELSSVLDKHAPLQSRMVTIRPAAPWFSEEIKLERRVRRRLERRWRRTRLPEDRLRFIEQKSCELDPVPSRILLGCLDLLCPVIWKIVKLFLDTSVMPAELKQAVIRPLLKKTSLDYQEFKNFRPISNLTFLSKVIEKVVALQLVDYIDNNGLCEVFRFQSAYRAHHSTETALLRVYNDIAMSIDNQKSVVFGSTGLVCCF